MANVKGTFLVNRFRYIDEKGKAGDKQRILEYVNPDLRRSLESGVLPIKWYPCSDYVELLQAMKKVMGPDDKEFYVKLGVFSASISLNSIYKMFMKIGSVETSMSKIPRMWNQLVDNGRLEFQVDGGNKAKIQVLEFDSISPEFCEALKGWMIGSFQICGVRQISITVDNLVVSSNGSAEYSCQWT